MWYIRGWVHFLCIKDPKWVGVMYRGGGGRLHRPARLNDRARTLGLWGSTAVLLWAYQWHHFSRTVLLEYFQTSKAFIIPTDYSDPEKHFRCLHDPVGHVPVCITDDCIFSCMWVSLQKYHYRGIEEAPPHKHCLHSLHHWHCLYFLCAADTACMLITLLTQLTLH